jgi:hypothetical protein
MPTMALRGFTSRDQPCWLAGHRPTLLSESKLAEDDRQRAEF